MAFPRALNQDKIMSQRLRYSLTWTPHTSALKGAFVLMNRRLFSALAGTPLPCWETTRA
jgi:hypothetical protein